MAIPTKRCKIHYRRLRRADANLPQGTFSDLLSTALNKPINGVLVKNNVNLRIDPQQGNSQTRRLINHCHIDNDFVFGNTCAFTPGQMQALLRTQADQKHGTLQKELEAYDIREAKAENGQEYIGGICYWLAIKDHFYQIQHISLQAKQMEEYFSWLLKDHTKTIASNALIELICEFDKAQVGVDLSEISNIEIGGLAPEMVYQPDHDSKTKQIAEDVETTETVGSEAAYFEKARDVLLALFGSVETNKILNEIPDEAALEVKVNIGYKAKKRKFNKEFMGNIASGLRNLPSGEMRVRGKDGEMRGSDIRLSEDMNIKRWSQDSSLLDMEHVLEQMLEVHRRFVHDGKI